MVVIDNSNRLASVKEKGSSAFRSGLKLSDNPYLKLSRHRYLHESAAWESGWCEAKVAARRDAE